MRILTFLFFLLLTVYSVAQDYPGITFEYQVYYSNGLNHHGIPIEAYLLDKKNGEITLTKYVAVDSCINFKLRPVTRNNETIGNMKAESVHTVKQLNDSTFSWSMVENWGKGNKKNLVYKAVIREDWYGQAVDMQFVMDCTFYIDNHIMGYPGSKQDPWHKVLRTRSVYIGH